MSSKAKVRKVIKWMLFYLMVLSVVMATLFPIYWVILTSFKYQRDFMSNPPGIYNR